MIQTLVSSNVSLESKSCNKNIDRTRTDYQRYFLFSVEGTQLVLDINHKHILIQIVFNSFCESCLQAFFNFSTGEVQCNYLAGLTVNTILLWKSLLFFLGGVPSFLLCVLNSRRTLNKRRRLFPRLTLKSNEKFAL